ILIRNTLPGNLILTGPITGTLILTGPKTGQNTSLTLQNLQGKVSVDGIDGVTDFMILNNLGTTEVNGNLSLTGTFNAVQSGSLTLNGNRAISANSILIDGITTQSNGTLKLTASTSGNISGGNISIGQITASEFSASGGTLILNGGITTGIGNKLDLSGMTSIELTGNSVLTGNLNLYLTDKDHTTGIYNTEGTTAYQLSIVSGSDLHLGEIGTAEHPLSSVRIQGNGNLTFASANGNIPIYTRGNDGIALLGNMNFIINEALTLNTAGYNGDLNLSGINIDGTGTLTLNSGDGDISLGNIGLNGAFAGLTIESASTLNLHGLLNLTKNTLDFSKVNSIILHSNQTWGTATTPYKVYLGNSSIDGTYNLNINAEALTMNGTIGANQA